MGTACNTYGTNLKIIQHSVKESEGKRLRYLGVVGGKEILKCFFLKEAGAGLA
jgi:hypothetical protein